MSTAFALSRPLAGPGDVRDAFEVLKAFVQPFNVDGDQFFFHEAPPHPKAPKMKLYRLRVGNVEFSAEVQTDNGCTLLSTTSFPPFGDPLHLGGTFGDATKGIRSTFAGESYCVLGEVRLEKPGVDAMLSWSFASYDKQYVGQKVLFSL